MFAWNGVGRRKDETRAAGGRDRTTGAKRAAPAVRRAAQCAVEGLEGRRLFAVTLDANGLLTAIGVPGLGHTVAINAAGSLGQTLRVTMDGVHHDFAAASVNSIKVGGNLTNYDTTINAVGAAQSVTVEGGGDYDETVTINDAGSATSVVVAPGGGHDVITINAAITTGVTVRGGSGNDTVTGGSGDDVLYGGNSSTGQWLYITDGDDVIYGGGGNDTIYGGSGTDVLEGQDGHDALYGQQPGYYSHNPLPDGNDTLRGGAGNDQLLGGDADDQLDGGDGNDLLKGEAGNDAHAGGAGNDKLIGGAGADAFDGGADSYDEVSYEDRDGAAAGVTVTVDGAANDGATGAGEGDNVAQSVEVVRATSQADAVSAAGRTDAAGMILNGTAGNDQLTGGPGADRLMGEGGDDQLFGGGGNDTLEGDAGNDLLIGQAGADAITGGGGWDTVDYAEKSAGISLTLDGQANDGTAGEGDNAANDLEELRATAHDDVVSAAGRTTGVRVYTFEGNDLLLGSEANDLLDGGAGNDTLQGRGGADDLWGGANWDKADYADKNAGVNLSADGQANDGTGNGAEGDNVRNDVEEMRATQFNDVLSAAGRTAGMVLFAAEGSDTLHTGGGIDVLDGGAGVDSARRDLLDLLLGIDILF